MIKVFDTEADGLFFPWSEGGGATKLHVVGWNKKVSPLCQAFIDDIDEGDTIIGHAIIDYDLPLMEKLEGIDYNLTPMTLGGKRVKFYDTLILSKLMHPDLLLPKGFGAYWAENYKGIKLPGPHSLAAWAYRLKTQGKVFIDDWHNLSYEEYAERVTQDVDITKALFDHFINEAKEQGLKLKVPYQTEMLVRHYHHKQVEYGVCFDTELAGKNIKFLDKELARLEGTVNPLLPERTVYDKRTYKPPKNSFKKADGKPTKNLEIFLGRMDYKPEVGEDGVWKAVPDFDAEHRVDMYPPIDIPDLVPVVIKTSSKEPMTISNQKAIKEWLMADMGWTPLYWNTNKKREKTSPKFHDKGNICPNLLALSYRFPVIDEIILWLSYRNRRSVILSKDGTGGLLNNPRLSMDGRVSAEADTIGTPTYRYTHKKVANIPRVTSLFGKEMRGMFIAPKGKVLVGWDAKSLEDCMKCNAIYHFPGGKDLADKLLNPAYDAHQENADAWGLPREVCKSGHYALQYLCKLPTFAKTLNLTVEEAAPFFDEWWDRHLPLRFLVDQMERRWESEGQKKWVEGIDGRRILTRAKHAILNFKLQSDGAIVMKRANVIWHREIERVGLVDYAHKVIDYHDEGQAECTPEVAEQAGQIGCWSITKAGESLGMNIPLSGDYKVGRSWAETH